jgi:hypothetical protein
MYPEARSVGAWLKGGWHVTVAYVVGFFVLLGVLGWHPDVSHRLPAASPNTASHSVNVPLVPAKP